jgi:hypothetical protein
MLADAPRQLAEAHLGGHERRDLVPSSRLRSLASVHSCNGLVLNSVRALRASERLPAARPENISQLLTFTLTL